MWPAKWTLEDIIRHGLAEILTNQKKHHEETMAAIDNLNTNVAQLKTDVDALLAQNAAATEAQIQSAADAVAAVDAEVKAKLAPAS